MQWLIPILVVVAVVAVIWLLRQPKSMRVSGILTSRGDPHGPIARKPLDNIADTPDTPIAFGYKMCWLAIRTSDTKDVIDALPIDDLQRANWQTGFVAAYEGHTFVSPRVDGWVFVLSQNLPELGPETDPPHWPMLLDLLAARFDDVQYFATHRVVGFHAWARFLNGEEQRAFAYFGERGETLVNRGQQTKGEHELGYRYFDETSAEAESDSYWEREDLTFPSEVHVMEVAGKWSINPQTLQDKEYPAGVGWIGAIRRGTDDR